MDNQSLVLVVPGRNLIRRFYPPILLLTTLTSMCPRRRRGEDPEFDPLAGLEQLFRAFVSKVAFLCCTEVGSGSISACAVLRLPDRIQYVIGFNGQSPIQSEKIASSIASILHLFAADPSHGRAEREHRKIQALQASLALCKGRVNGYLKSLKTHMQECIKSCQRECTSDSKSIQNEMSRILDILDICFELSPYELGERPRTTVNPFAVCDLICSLSNFFRSDVFTQVKYRLAREDNMMPTTFWSDFVHVGGRLLSYKRAVDSMNEVSEIWPELFSNIQIHVIASSSPVSDVLSKNPQTAWQIMGRTTSDEKLLSRFAKQVTSLSVHDIDTRISELWRNAPKPIVHAEVLVHSWLENTEGGIRPERFFNRWKFIGSSKPPCKLCSYFFDEYPTDVQVRPSHQNTYFAWRMPDIYEHQGAESITKQNLVMESIKTRIRADVVRLLSEKLSDGRPHDSSAYISSIPDTVLVPVSNFVSPEATARLLESCTLSTTQDQDPAPRETDEGVDNVVDHHHEEVLLFKGRSAGRKNVYN